nr:hypothetical protein [Tanacetum cinerariifolium]
MGDENPIRNLGDYSKPSHEGYRNTIELLVGNKVVHLRSDIIWLVQNGCSFHGLRSEDPNQHLKCKIDCAAGGKLCNKNTNESWEIIENLALYNHEGWGETKEFVKPIKAIVTPQGILKTPDQRRLELEDQINFLLKGSRPTPTSSSAPTPQASHTERMGRFKNAIFKQREEINGRMTEMFRLLKELTTNRTPEKVLIGEEAKFTVTKNVNSISLTKGEEEGCSKTEITPKNTEKPTETETEIPVKEAETKNEAENKAENKSIKTPENEKAVQAPGSQHEPELERKMERHIKYYLGAVYDAIIRNKITKKKDIRGNFKIPCSIGGLKHVNALVDQGSNVNIMPYSTYTKLTDKKPAKIDIRLSLASHSYIYPLEIAEDVLVKVSEHIYHVDFVIMDIKENEKRPFIIGILFLTTKKAVIKFDTSTKTLRSGKIRYVSIGYLNPSVIPKKESTT